MNEDKQKEEKKGCLPHEDTLSQDEQKCEKKGNLPHVETVNEFEQKGETKGSLPHADTMNGEELQNERKQSMPHRDTVNEGEQNNNKEDVVEQNRPNDGIEEVAPPEPASPAAVERWPAVFDDRINATMDRVLERMMRWEETRVESMRDGMRAEFVRPPNG